MSNEMWTEPQATWVPLKTAVFKFGILVDAPASSEEQLSLTTREMRTSENRSLAELTNLLKEICGASSVEIDPVTATFTILFPEGDARKFTGHPSDLLTLALPGYSQGHTHILGISREEVLRRNVVAEAIEAVWSKSMLPAFNRAIAAETIALYARPHIASPHFQRLPAHVWRLLTVADWKEGVAKAIDNTAFWAIHADLIATGDQSRVLSANFDLQDHEILTDAPLALIRATIKEVYDKAEAARNKPPNIKELPAAVSPALKQKGYRASDRLIMELGDEPEFKRRRLPQGKRPRVTGPVSSDHG